MHQTILIVERATRIAVGLSFCVLMTAVLIQVLGRSVLADSPVWTEELTRFALLFLAAFGTGLSYRSGDLVNVDLICGAMSEDWSRWMRLISTLATIFLCIALLWPAWTYTSIGALQTSPALGWRMDFIHASMLVLLISLLIFAVLQAVSVATGKLDDDQKIFSGDDS